MSHLLTIVFLAACATLVVSQDNQEAFDDHDLEAFDNLETRRYLETDDDLEALDMMEARGNQETLDNLDALDNLETLDKRLLKEQALQLENAEVFIDAKLASFKGKLVAGFSGKDESVSYKISNIKISDLALDLNPKIKVNGPRSVELTLRLPRFTVDGDWWARYKEWLAWLGRSLSITRDGEFTATANSISVTVTVSLSPLEVEDCRANADLSLKVRGGGLVTKIFLLFEKSSVVNDLEDKVEAAICGTINKL